MIFDVVLRTLQPPTGGIFHLLCWLVSCRVALRLMWFSLKSWPCVWRGFEGCRSVRTSSAPAGPVFVVFTQYNEVWRSWMFILGNEYKRPLYWFSDCSQLLKKSVYYHPSSLRRKKACKWNLNQSNQREKTSHVILYNSLYIEIE